MKLIHTSDWHLGHELYGHDRTADHRHFIDSLCRIVAEEQPHLLVVSGDVYNTSVPSNAVMTMLNESLMSLHRACPTMRIALIAGNHDSPSRIEVARSVWDGLGVGMTGIIRRLSDGSVDYDSLINEVIDPSGMTAGLVVSLPYVYSGAYPLNPGETADRSERQSRFMAGLSQAVERRLGGNPYPVVMCAHLAVTGCDDSSHEERGGLDYIPLEHLPVPYDYLALGHIHCRQTFHRGHATARYCGTPVGVSFDENPVHTVSVVTINAHGDTPVVAEREIDQPRPLLTIPSPGSGAMTYEEALETMRKFDRDAYLRMRVTLPDVPPPHAVENAVRAASEGQGRFCSFLWEHPEQEGCTDNDDKSYYGGLDTLMAMTPAEVARRYYADRTGHEMPPDLSELIDSVIAEVQANGGEESQ